MAIIYQNPNGKISGRLGPIYARIVNGRNIFAIMPIPTGREQTTPLPIDRTITSYLRIPQLLNRFFLSKREVNRVKALYDWG